MKTAVGVVCYRDEAGDMTGRVRSIYREISERESVDESGMTKSGKAFADSAADFFERLLLENKIAEYSDAMKEELN